MILARPPRIQRKRARICAPGDGRNSAAARNRCRHTNERASPREV